jgi:hypothetical protein
LDDGAIRSSPSEAWSVCGFACSVARARESSRVVRLNFGGDLGGVGPYWFGPPSSPFAQFS